MHQTFPSSQLEEGCFSPLLIDWHEQWAACGWIDCGSHFEICLQECLPGHKQIVKMAAGPGFGDLTHPTTRLTLQMLADMLPGNHFIDVGCGSGILTLAALKLGAVSATGVDIDRASLNHARENARLNDLDATFACPEEFVIPTHGANIIIAMNMIYSEQQIAWPSLPMLHNRRLQCVTSGILNEHKKHYLEICKAWGWILQATKKQKKWLAFNFQT